MPAVPLQKIPLIGARSDDARPQWPPIPCPVEETHNRQEKAMATSQPTRPQVAALWRTARRAVAVLRAIHDQQVLMWELFWQSSRVAIERTGPLAWTPSLDGPRPPTPGA